MTLRAVMQASPTKANELFVKLSDTSDGAVKTRERLFTELRSELELHARLEEEYLFPILRRNAETKELVAEASKDNKALRATLAELEVVPKNDTVFPERLKELQKVYRQHARDEKRELLPAVQRALSEEQVQGIAEKIEAGVAEAGQARQDELEERRLKARQEREQADRQAERQVEAERAQQAAAEQARHEEAAQKRLQTRQEREAVERHAERQAAAQQAQDEAERRTHQVTETVARAVTAPQTSILQIAKSAAANAQRIGAEIQGVTDIYLDAVKGLIPDPETVAALPKVAVGAMTDIRSAWIEWIGQTTRAGTQLSQDLLRQAAEQQQRFAADAMQGWMAHNARIMEITMRAAQESFRSFANHSAGSDDRGSAR